jgi:hypothetical protein
VSDLISLATPPKRDRKKTFKKSARPAKTSPKRAQPSGDDLNQARSRPGITEGVAPTCSKLDGAARSSEDTISTSRDAQQPQASTNDQLTIFTIGHSTHPIDEFISILKHYGIGQLVDVRTVPKSRHVPQFNSDALDVELAKQGFKYVHLKALGGLRHAKKDSVNMGWRNASFRGYADYMATDEFTKGIDRLIELAKAKRTAIMCAEAVPWRCHRSLIGDALLVRGVTTEDIMGATSVRPHKLTEFAKVDGQKITYPADKNLELFSV